MVQEKAEPMDRADQGGCHQTEWMASALRPPLRGELFSGALRYRSSLKRFLRNKILSCVVMNCPMKPNQFGMILLPAIPSSLGIIIQAQSRHGVT